MLSDVELYSSTSLPLKTTKLEFDIAKTAKKQKTISLRDGFLVYNLTLN
jgi:hypothetical protein